MCVTFDKLTQILQNFYTSRSGGKNMGTVIRVKYVQYVKKNLHERIRQPLTPFLALIYMCKSLLTHV